MNRIPLLIPMVAVASMVVGCSSSTPQASAEVKTQIMGRKPTAEEMEAAMRKSSAAAEAARASAMNRSQ